MLQALKHFAIAYAEFPNALPEHQTVQAAKRDPLRVPDIGPKYPSRVSRFGSETAPVKWRYRRELRFGIECQRSQRESFVIGLMRIDAK